MSYFRVNYLLYYGSYLLFGLPAVLVYSGVIPNVVVHPEVFEGGDDDGDSDDDAIGCVRIGGNTTKRIPLC